MAAGKKALAELHAKYFSDEIMILLALVAVILFFVETVITLPDWEQMAILIIDWLIWSTFVMDLTLKLYCAPSLVHYITTKRGEFLIDALIVLSPLALLLTPFEQDAWLAPLLRIARFERLVRLVRVVAYIPLVISGLDKISSSFYRHKFYHYFAFTVLSVFLCAALAYSYEHGKATGLNSYEDALWWATVTVATTTTPIIPMTPEGRLISGFLIVVGIGLLAILTANIAAYFVESQRQQKPHTDELGAINRKLERIERLLAKKK